MDTSGATAAGLTTNLETHRHRLDAGDRRGSTGLRAPGGERTIDTDARRGAIPNV
jgi:hypothetical protein